jgi:hypothetical protein
VSAVAQAPIAHVALRHTWGIAQPGVPAGRSPMSDIAHRNAMTRHAGRSPGLRVGQTPRARRLPMPVTLTQWHIAAPTLAYRCGGSAGMVQPPLGGRTGFPFNPGILSLRDPGAPEVECLAGYRVAGLASILPGGRDPGVFLVVAQFITLTICFYVLFDIRSSRKDRPDSLPAFGHAARLLLQACRQDTPPT